MIWQYDRQGSDQWFPWEMDISDGLPGSSQGKKPLIPLLRCLLSIVLIFKKSRWQFDAGNSDRFPDPA